MAGRLPPRPGCRRRPAHPGLAGAHHPCLRRPRTWPRVRHLGGIDRGADRRRPDRSAASSSTPLGWRVAFLINVPLLGFALWATLTHVQESRDTESTGRFDWLGALVAALAVGGLAFGVIRGQANEWQDLAAWISIAIGVVALIAFPILMARRPDPLVPLAIFRSRAFTAINLMTFFVYGALYVTFFYQAVVLQGVLGYTALGAGLVGLPVGIMLATLSTRIGTVAGRMGSRRFLVAGPILMALGLLWFARLPVDSTPWTAAIDDPASFVPPASAVIDVLPYSLLFGLGISLRRGAADEHPDGLDLGALLGDRLGHQQLDRAGRASRCSARFIFIAISATYYASLGSAAGLDTDDPAVRTAFQPLNPPVAGATAAQIAASNQASMDAFHLAMLACAGLLAIGAFVAWYGLREGAGAPVTSAEPAAPAA